MKRNHEPLVPQGSSTASQTGQAGPYDDNVELLERCSAGDQDAWVNIVRRYERLVYAIGLREGLSAEQAADVTQETFVALLTNLDHITDPKRLGAWLATVARRQTWRLRQLRSASFVPLRENDAVVDESSGDLATALWVHQAIEQLDAPWQELVHALFFDPDEPSYSDVARQLGRPVGSIGPLRIRCLTRLRRILEEAT